MIISVIGPLLLIPKEVGGIKTFISELTDSFMLPGSDQQNR